MRFLVLCLIILVAFALVESRRGGRGRDDRRGRGHRGGGGRGDSRGRQYRGDREGPRHGSSRYRGSRMPARKWYHEFSRDKGSWQNIQDDISRRMEGMRRGLDKAFGTTNFDFDIPSWDNIRRHGYRGRARGRGSWMHEMGRLFGNFDVDFDLSGVGRMFQTSWWKGPNVCTRVSVSSENVTEGVDRRRHSGYAGASVNCEDTDTSHTCITTINRFGQKKTVTRTHECCLGFERIFETSGCRKEVELAPLLSTILALNGTEFLAALNMSNVTEVLQVANFTIFLPSNKAFRQFQVDLANKLESQLPELPNVIMVDDSARQYADNAYDKLQQVLYSHIVPGWESAGRLKDGRVIDTVNPASNIRINFFTGRSGLSQVATANCIKITRSDIGTTNGIIHQIDGVLMPTVNNVYELIAKHPNLTIFSEYLQVSGLADELSDKDSEYTVFAPTDDVLKRLNLDESCRLAITKKHIVPTGVCSIAASPFSSVTLRNLFGDAVGFRRRHGYVTYGDVNATETDLVGTNGVVHIVDGVVSFSKSNFSKNPHHKHFSNYISNWEKKQGSRFTNYTIFLPPKPMNMTNEEVQSHILHPTASPKYLGCRRCHCLRNNRRHVDLNSSPVLVKEYSSFPFGAHSVKTVQCAKILPDAGRTCKGNVYLVDRPLPVVRGNIMSTLRDNEQFSGFVDAIERVGLDELLESEGPKTVVVVPNEMSDIIKKWESLSDFRLRRVLSQLIVKDVICCSGIFESQYRLGQYTRTLARQSIRLGRSGDIVLYGGRPLDQCDIVSTNGVIHVFKNQERDSSEREGEDFPIFNGDDDEDDSGSESGEEFVPPSKRPENDDSGPIITLD